MDRKLIAMPGAAALVLLVAGLLLHIAGDDGPVSLSLFGMGFVAVFAYLSIELRQSQALLAHELGRFRRRRGVGSTPRASSNVPPARRVVSPEAGSL